MRLRLSEFRTCIRRSLIVEGQFEDEVNRLRPTNIPDFDPDSPDEAASDDETLELQAEFDQLVQRLIAQNLKKVEYLRFAVRCLFNVTPTERPSIVAEILSVLSKFVKMKAQLPANRRDIASYQSLGEMRGALEEIETARENVYDMRAARQDATVILENENFLVIEPTTTQSSCVLGRGTKWCVSATQSQNFFEIYSTRGIFLAFVLVKGEMARKIASNAANKNFLKVAFSCVTDYDGEMDMRRLEVWDSADNSMGTWWSKELSAIWGDDNLHQIVNAIKTYIKQHKDNGFLRRIKSMSKTEMERHFDEADRKEPSGGLNLAIQWIENGLFNKIDNPAARNVVLERATGTFVEYTEIDHETGQRYGDRSIVKKYYEGKLHSSQGPAVIDQEAFFVGYYMFGKPHREDGPAKVGYEPTERDEISDTYGYYESTDDLERSKWFIDGKEVEQFTEDQGYNEAARGEPARLLSSDEIVAMRKEQRLKQLRKRGIY